MAEELTKQLIARLRPLYEAARDPERALGAKAYIRNQFDFFGIPAPAQELIARRACDGLDPPTERDLGRLAVACWKEPEREWQYFACGYLRRNVTVASAGFIEIVESLITTKSWWDTIDALASRTVGALVAAHPGLVATMDEWVDSDNIWIARTAILHQLHHKSETDAARLFDYCTRRANDKEFFIRKAIGWALREYTKTDEHAVRRFVSDHHELSPLSRTEAMKWLDRRTARTRRSSQN